MKYIIISFIGLMSFTSCAQETNESKAVKEQSTNIAKRITREEFQSLLATSPKLVLVDVRTPEEYKEGTIGNAINMDFTASNFEEQIQALDKSVPTLIFCQAGGRSARALKVMAKNNFQTVYELEGGYGGWNR